MYCVDENAEQDQGMERGVLRFEDADVVDAGPQAYVNPQLDLVDVAVEAEWETDSTVAELPVDVDEAL